MTRADSRLGKSARQSRIMEELRATPTLRVNDLSARLSVSTETVRRDLADLDEAGKINRTYGGAMRAVRPEPGLAVREGLMPAERARIADAAVQRVDPGDILAIGGGATTLHFARRLASSRDHLTVITHAFSVAAALAANVTHKVLMLPGQFDGREGLIHGPDTVETLHRFHVSKAFLGASGLTAEGPNDAGLGPGLVYGAMMRRTAQTFILADHTKFDNPSLTVYGAWSRAMTLITDQPPSGSLAVALADAGVAVVVAGA
ncbi:DeoR/GlpR family DNA-binding transcription regulator [Paracoccaceae bacterium Fryx2]|nr:DeoR/GlpR family DNA-binding transcription regulator [Paracoccaceae bacterium Fryx2]